MNMTNEYVSEDLIFGRRIHYWEIFLLKICYAWAVVDCKNPIEALHTYRLFHPTTGTLRFRQICGVSAVDHLLQLCDDLKKKESTVWSDRETCRRQAEV